MSNISTLYGRLGSGSAVCEAILVLTGLPHELIDLDRWQWGEPPAALLAVSPLSQVPALILPDGDAMTESAAIALYLADIAPEAKLAPAVNHPDRRRYLRWMLFLATQSYPTALRMYYPERHTSDAAAAGTINIAAVARSGFEWSVFAEALGDGPFIMGNQFGAVDLYAAMLVSWDMDQQRLFEQHPNLHQMYQRVASIPALQGVWERHGI